jgi:hypothetical protein
MPMVFNSAFTQGANRRRGPLPLVITILVLLSIGLVSLSGLTQFHLQKFGKQLYSLKLGSLCFSVL